MEQYLWLETGESAGVLLRKPWEEVRTNHMDLEFKELKAEDVAGLVKYYGQREDKTCDSTIFDNFLWRRFYDFRYAVRDDRALLWIMTIDGETYGAMPVCSLEDLPRYFKEMEQYFNETLGQALGIYLADEITVGYLNLPPEQYQVEELIDLRDYLYDAEALRTLSGKKLHKKKNHLNSFLKEYAGRYEYRRLCFKERQDVWSFLDQWRATKGQEVEHHLDPEVEGIHAVLKNYVDDNARMGGVYVDGKLEAFSIGSYNAREKMAIIHIEKANPDIVGLYQFINQQFLIHEFPEAELVNREDDMGLPGLRQAKMSYAPAGFARKFRIRQIWKKESERA